MGFFTLLYFCALLLIQILESPGYRSPGYYPPNTRCQWLIEAPPLNSLENGRRRRIYGRNQGRRVHLKFLSMDVGIGTTSTSQPCSQGFVSMQDHLPQVCFYQRNINLAYCRILPFFGCFK